MSAGHRKHLERCTSAPVVAWLIDHDYVADECGILEVTSLGRAYLREAMMNAMRETRGALPTPIERLRA